MKTIIFTLGNGDQIKGRVSEDQGHYLITDGQADHRPGDVALAGQLGLFGEAPKPKQKKLWED